MLVYNLQFIALPLVEHGRLIVILSNSPRAPRANKAIHASSPAYDDGFGEDSSSVFETSREPSLQVFVFPLIHTK